MPALVTSRQPKSLALGVLTVGFGRVLLGPRLRERNRVVEVLAARLQLVLRRGMRPQQIRLLRRSCFLRILVSLQQCRMLRLLRGDSCLQCLFCSNPRCHHLLLSSVRRFSAAQLFLQGGAQLRFLGTPRKGVDLSNQRAPCQACAVRRDPSSETQ